jgi:ADP-ribosylglycohydrolase
MVKNPTLIERFRGVILGAAVGDALGLPAEGISPQRARRLFGRKWRHRFLFSRGMVSDDTDHAVFVAQSMLRHPGSHELFARRLAMCLRWWLISLPAGVGFATFKAILRLWAGFSPSGSGVYSAGNGPAMRSAPIGAFFAGSPEKIDEYTRASTCITHTDPRALTGAKAVAHLTAWCVRDGITERPGIHDVINMLKNAGGEDEEWKIILDSLSASHQKGLSVEEFAHSMGLAKGITGYVYHTVPVAVYAWYRHLGDFKSTLEAVLNCGGDTDTTGAIAGALAGAVAGERGIPGQWLDGIAEWPRSVKVLKRIADALAECSEGNKGCSPQGYFWPGLIPRNLVFMVLVLMHGLRRLLPPY